MTSIYLDLDGPLLDVSLRHWKVYSDVLRASGYPYVLQEEYWELKRAGISTADILGITGAGPVGAHYAAAWLERIEIAEYLGYDQVWNGVDDMLSELRFGGCRLVLVTLRRNRETLIQQLESLGMLGKFRKVISSGADREIGWQQKAEMIAGDLADGSWGFSTVVGDTETDICAGKHLGLPTVGVAFGIRSSQQLKRLNPDYLAQTPEDLRLYLARLVHTVRGR